MYPCPFCTVNDRDVFVAVVGLILVFPSSMVATVVLTVQPLYKV